MPEQSTIQRAREDQREGKSAATQAGEFVREQFHHIRAGRHGARSARQAIAIGLSEARRAGVALPAPSGKSSLRAGRHGRRESGTGQRGKAEGIQAPRVAATRSRASRRALEREGQAAASPTAISRQARASARRRSPKDRPASARKAAQTRKAPIGKSRRLPGNAARETTAAPGQR